MGKKTRKFNFSTVQSDLESMNWKQFNQNYDSIIMEQWKVCVEAANGITEKRNSVNSIFVTVNIALFAVITFSLDYKSIFLSVVGILICILWKQLVDNYKSLNNVKYNIICEIETLLPLSPLKAEWNRLCNHRKYTELTKIEKYIPIIFICLYGIAIFLPLFRCVLQFECMYCGLNQ